MLRQGQFAATKAASATASPQTHQFQESLFASKNASFETNLKSSQNQEQHTTTGSNNNDDSKIRIIETTAAMPFAFLQDQSYQKAVRQFAGCVGEEALLRQKIEELKQEMGRKKKGLSTSHEQRRRKRPIDQMQFHVQPNDSVMDSAAVTPRLGSHELKVSFASHQHNTTSQDKISQYSLFRNKRSDQQASTQLHNCQTRPTQCSDLGSTSEPIFDVKMKAQVSNIIMKRFPERFFQTRLQSPLHNLFSSENNSPQKPRQYSSQLGTQACMNKTELDLRRASQEKFLRRNPNFTKQLNVVDSKHEQASQLEQRLQVNSNSKSGRCSRLLSPRSAVETQVVRSQSTAKHGMRPPQLTSFSSAKNSVQQERRRATSLFRNTRLLQTSNDSKKKQSPAADDIVSRNVKLASTHSRSRPSVSIWLESDHPKLDYSVANQKQQQSKLIKKERKMIVQMTMQKMKDLEQHVKNQGCMTAKEILASAGISSVRVQQQEACLSQPLNEGLAKLTPLSPREQQQIVDKIIDDGKSMIDPVQFERRRAERMVGGADYPIPSNDKLKKHFEERQLQKKKTMREDLAQNQDIYEGQMTVQDCKVRQESKLQTVVDPHAVYIKGFQDCATVFTKKPTLCESDLDQDGGGDTITPFIFGQILQERALTHMASETFKLQLAKRMCEAKRQQSLKGHDATGLSESDESDGKQFAPTNIFRTNIQEENMTIGKIGKDFLQKLSFNDKLKRKELTYAGKGVMDDQDPKLKLYEEIKNCSELAMPLLEKINHQTLMLQEFSLSVGHCKGLAIAIPFLDGSQFQKLFLDNCGMTGEQFAPIVEALRSQKQVKSIIYRMNGMNEQVMHNFRPILHRKRPNNLQELKLIDCGLNGSQIEVLMDHMIDIGSQLRSLALVNATQTIKSFAAMVQFVNESQWLRELDLSWTQVKTSNAWSQLIEVVKDHASLTKLNLSHNRILEDQNHKLSQEQIASGLQYAPLSALNKVISTNLREMISNNQNMVHVNLDFTGLFESVVFDLLEALRQSFSLNCLHLTGNLETNGFLLHQVQSTLAAKPPKGTTDDDQNLGHIPTFYAAKRQLTKSSTSRRRYIAKRQESIYNEREMSLIHEETKWQQIRKGIKLKQISRQRSMHQQTRSKSLRQRGAEKMILVLTRHLGLDQVIPKLSQWRILSQIDEECWLCEKHMLTVYIWTPTIGLFTMIKDETEVGYYRGKLKELNGSEAQFNNQSIESSSSEPAAYAPRFASASTGWIYKPMQEMTDFCKANDIARPNFVKMAARQGKLPQSRADAIWISDEEREVVGETERDYYQRFWQTVLMRMLRYQRPLFANAQRLTQMSIQSDPSQKIFCHFEMLSPGRHMYAVLNEARVAPQQPSQQEKQTVSNFHLHDIIVGYREEPVPTFKQDPNGGDNLTLASDPPDSEYIPAGSSAAQLTKSVVGSLPLITMASDRSVMQLASQLEHGQTCVQSTAHLPDALMTSGKASLEAASVAQNDSQLKAKDEARLDVTRLIPSRSSSHALIESADAAQQAVRSESHSSSKQQKEKKLRPVVLDGKLGEANNDVEKMRSQQMSFGMFSDALEAADAVDSERQQ